MLPAKEILGRLFETLFFVEGASSFLGILLIVLFLILLALSFYLVQRRVAIFLFSVGLRNDTLNSDHQNDKLLNSCASTMLCPNAIQAARRSALFAECPQFLS